MVISPGCFSISEISRLTASRRGLRVESWLPGAAYDGQRILRERAGVIQRAPAAFELLGHGGGVDQGIVGAQRDGERTALQQVEDVEHVLRALRRPDVAGHDGDGLNGHFRGAAQEHDQRGAVIAEKTRIGIEDDGLLAGARAGLPAIEFPSENAP